ncbi:hypothetical protein RBA63_12190 [Brenneria goodwinii]|uniref:hypothetical protein n=1 Tax=Brenneria goodwinii TaxID=1109412 RepID=UPI0036EEBB5E
MNKPVFLAEMAYAALEEIKYYQRDIYIRQGDAYSVASEKAQAFIETLILGSTESIASSLVTWGFDLDMADRGISVKKWFDHATGYLCFFDDGGDEIAILYYASPKQDYINALYRILSIYLP